MIVSLDRGFLKPPLFFALLFPPCRRCPPPESPRSLSVCMYVFRSLGHGVGAGAGGSRLLTLHGVVTMLVPTSSPGFCGE